METSAEKKRENGIYYTPAELAEYLAKPLVCKSNLNILDPAYGEGALLLAAERVYKKQLNQPEGVNLFGCDTKPVNGLLKHLPEANLKRLDFFEYPVCSKFDVVLMNPPYVRHHLQDHKAIKRYRESFPELKQLSFASDLWSYFIIKAKFHLKLKGSIGAILPWSFSQADYAKPLRQWLAQHFRKIKLLALNEKYFDEAEERVVLLWLEDHGQKCDTIQVASAKHLDEEIVFKEIRMEDWIADRIHFASVNDTMSILQAYQEKFEFSTLENFADVKIGVVTGADNFFIRSYQDAKRYGFTRRDMTPILTTTRDFPELLSNGPESLKGLITLKKKQEKKYIKYLLEGKQNEYHLRAHAKLREPWYAVKIGNVPDAFFPYRISKYPFLLFNDHKIQCTNSVHRIYFKNIDKEQRKWVAISLLSNIGQLSVEVNSKTYGRGMLKVEPKSLKKTLVITNNDFAIHKVYDEVMQQLKFNRRHAAMSIATKFIDKQIRIPRELSQACTDALTTLQSFRLD